MILCGEDKLAQMEPTAEMEPMACLVVPRLVEGGSSQGMARMGSRANMVVAGAVAAAAVR